MAKEDINKKLFEEANKYLVGGVNSPIRSFKAVSGTPVFIKKALGSKLYGEDGKSYIDYCLSWGGIILGHANSAINQALTKAIKNGTSYGAATKLETELAEIILDAFPFMEKIRMTNSGAEAVTSACRIAKAYTGREKIVKFEGGFHGGGIPDALQGETVNAQYNDLNDVERNIKGAAAVLVEAVAGNMGVVLPQKGFLKGLREICKKNGALLILDEVITGFRIRYGGVQNLFDVEPDLTTLGKIIGGGLPAGAVLGKKEIMAVLSPVGELLQTGTFSGNPATVSAGVAALRLLKKKNLYPALDKKTKKLCKAAVDSAKKNGIDIQANQIGPMFSFFFTGEKVVNYKTARTQDNERFKKFFFGLFESGVYFSPSALEAEFLSAAHTDADIKKTISAIEKSLRGAR